MSGNWTVKTPSGIRRYRRLAPAVLAAGKHKAIIMRGGKLVTVTFRRLEDGGIELRARWTA